MQLATIHKAAMITGQPVIRLIYAVNDGLLDHVVVRGTIVVCPQDVLNCRDSGSLRNISHMIKRTLFRLGFWRKSWEDEWERPEPPMDESDYIEWMKEKAALMEDKSMGFAERVYWQNRGVL